MRAPVSTITVVARKSDHDAMGSAVGKDQDSVLGCIGGRVQIAQCFLGFVGLPVARLRE